MPSTHSARGSAGRAVGLGAATLWVVAPWLTIPLFDHGLPREVRRAVPAAGDRPHRDARSSGRRSRSSSAALLTARALDQRRASWAGAAAGLGAGLAVGDQALGSGGPSGTRGRAGGRTALALALRRRTRFGCPACSSSACGRRAASATCRRSRRERRTVAAGGRRRAGREVRRLELLAAAAHRARPARRVLQRPAASSCSRWEASSLSPGERFRARRSSAGGSS